MGLATGSLKLSFIDTGTFIVMPPTADVLGTLTAPSAISTAASKVYAVPYINTPTVILIPTTNCGGFYLSASSNTGFTVTFTTAGTHKFSYLVISND
jgi:hypothetical protein